MSQPYKTRVSIGISYSLSVREKEAYAISRILLHFSAKWLVEHSAANSRSKN